MAMKFLMGFLRRDAVAPPELARFFMEQTLSPQPGIRASAEQYVLLVKYAARRFIHLFVSSQGNREDRRSHEDTSVRQN
jgi:hypothetical protein